MTKNIAKLMALGVLLGASAFAFSQPVGVALMKVTSSPSGLLCQSGDVPRWLVSTGEIFRCENISNGQGTWTSDMPAAGPVSNPITTATTGTGVTSATCATATCTNLRGTYTIVGGTGTTGTILTLVWPTTGAAYVCTVMQNDTGQSTGFLGLGHTVATATGMVINAGITVVGTTFNVDYSCKP